MKFSKSALVGAALLMIAPVAFGQVPNQTLSVSFVNFNATVPLSDWLTVAMALLLAASAVAVLRRQTGRAGRLLGGLLALVAGTTLFTATGQQVVSPAHANPLTLLSLTVSPSALDVTSYVPTSPLVVTVMNNSGQSARITAIDLNTFVGMGTNTDNRAKQSIIGFYTISNASQCQLGTVLSPGVSCTITLIGNV